MPPLSGAGAILFSIAAVVMPTVIRLDILPADSEPCTIFCPFVLATALICGWRYAVAVAIAGATVCNTIIMGTPYRFHWETPELDALATFLAYSFFVILIVQLFRVTAGRSLRQAGAEENASGIVFSADNGQAWASWYGVDAPVRLGPQDEVAKMMEDFLAQVELSRRLAHRRRTHDELSPAEENPGHAGQQSQN